MIKSMCRRAVSAFLVVCLFSLCLTIGSSTSVSATVKLNAKSKTIDVGSTFSLKISGTTKKVVWTSSDKKIVTVSKSGKIKGIKGGSANITAKVDNKKYVCKIKVRPVINKKTAWVEAGQKVTLKIKGTNKKVKWSSSNTKIATVNSKGEVITKKKGSVTIKGKVDGKTYKCKFTVWNKGTKESIKYIQEVVDRVNKARTKKGLKKLKLNIKLCEAAMKRSEELTERFDHLRPDGSSCFTVFGEFGFEVNSYKGENIAYGYVNPEKVMEDWMSSQGHRDNILSKDFEEIGVGVINKDGYRHWTQLFYGI